MMSSIPPEIPTRSRPRVRISRRAIFSAAHFYYLNHRSEAENWALFNLCSNRHGHGHNYAVYLTVSGPTQEETGMVLNLKDLKALLDESLVASLDHKHLNHEIPFFKDHVPTLENISQYAYQAVQHAEFPSETTLEHLKVIEQDDLSMEYPLSKEPRSDLMMQTTPFPPSSEAPPLLYLNRQYEFSASHRLYNPTFSEEKNWATYGSCNNPNGHGHNYILEVTVAGSPDSETGMLVNLLELDAQVHTHLIQRVDHRHLNLDVSFFQGVIPTAENIAVVFWEQLQPHIPQPASLYRIRIIETRNNTAEYMGERVKNPE